MIITRTPSEITEKITSIILRELDENYLPSFFITQSKSLIDNAIEWQAQNQDKDIFKDYNLEQKVENHIFDLCESPEGQLYELSDENFDKVDLYEEAKILYREACIEATDENLCDEFDFNPEELRAIKELAQYREEQEVREVMGDTNEF